MFKSESSSHTEGVLAFAQSGWFLQFLRLAEATSTRNRILTPVLQILVPKHLLRLYLYPSNSSQGQGMTGGFWDDKGSKGTTILS